MSDDPELLRQYVESGSESAFRELVERHIQLVYSTARRKAANDAHLAHDITQIVFTDLARKAASLPQGVVLAGWLYRHVCFIAAKAVRTESRRRARERTAMEIHATHENDAQDAQWAQLAPVLDDALNQLGDEDRDAIVLRYLQNRDLRSIGQTLGVSDDTAQKRIARALEKLRGYLACRSLTLSSILLASSLDAGAQNSLPHGLARSVSATALHAASLTTPITLNSLLQLMITSKLCRFALVLAIIGAGMTLVVRQHSAAINTPATSAAPSAAIAPTVAIRVATPAIAAPAPKTSVTPSNIPGNIAQINISAPIDVPTESHSSTVRISNGIVTSTANDNGVVQTQAQSLPATGMVTGGNGNLNFVASAGSLPTEFFPAPTTAPTSTTVNADGSTTNTYAGPNGSITEITVSADGKSRSMKSMMGSPPSSN